MSSWVSGDWDFGFRVEGFRIEGRRVWELRFRVGNMSTVERIGGDVVAEQLASPGHEHSTLKSKTTQTPNPILKT